MTGRPAGGMERRDFLRLAATTAMAPVLGACGAEGDAAASGRSGAAGDAGAGELTAEAARAAGWAGYDEAVVIDALAGPIQFNIPQEALPLRAEALDAVRESGITALNLTVNARPEEGATALETTTAKMAAWRDEVDAHPETFLLVRPVGAIGGAKSAGRLGLVFGLQDGVPFEDDLERLADFHAAGLRIVQPTYNVRNRLGSGSLVSEDEGLTELGRWAVARMDELGILLDLSHCGPRTTVDGLRASAGPASITHSGCNAVYRHPRSKDDETLRLMADRGGVLGVYLMPFLNPAGAPTAADVIRHVEHALNVCGEDHVGIGSDQGIVPLDVSGDFPTRFEAVSRQRAAAGIAAPREDTVPYVPELNHHRRLETIPAMMASRGHSSAVIDKVLGANLLRLFSEVWT